MATVLAVLLLLPLGIGCAGQAATSPAPAAASHMDCEDERSPAAPVHDCTSDCALACAALPAPPSATQRSVASAIDHVRPVPASLAHLINGPAPPPPRG